MSEIVEVVINLPLNDGLFDYHVPSELEGKIKPGCLVEVSFGKQRVQAVVLRFVDQAQVPETKPIETLLDDDPVVTPAQLELASWLSRETLSPLADCVRLMLPPGLSQQADTLFSLTEKNDNLAALTDFQKDLVKRVKEKGPLRGRQFESAYPRKDWKSSIRVLIKTGWIVARPVLPLPSVRPKIVRSAQLACPREEGERILAEARRIGGENAYQRRWKVIEYLAQEGAPVNATWIYAASGSSLPDLQRLEELGVITLGETELWRDPLQQIEVGQTEIPDLTPEQQAAWETIQAAVQRSERCLVHGVTGSGKTEIYLRAVKEVLSRGKQVIILVPEIGLTPQTVRRFMARFAGRVGLVHSHLSPGERYDTWRRARMGKLSVIVGARSALFTPLPDLGLIVVDECHDSSYAQMDTSPAFQAVEAAVAYAQIAGAGIIMGSATPQVTQMHRAEREQWHIVKLPTRILAHQKVISAQMAHLGRSAPDLNRVRDAASLPLPPVTVVDMREELKQGNRSMLSRVLIEEITRVLDHHEQGILFLNRRGSAAYVFCRDCGFVVRCPKCNLSLTAHMKDTQLICHTCGYTRQMPKTCPSCKSSLIRPLGAGTEKVEAEVTALFPMARVLRWDADTTRQKGAHEILMSHFVHHRVDLMIGTQMLAKGLDLPLVTLVGAVLADVGLNLPDFRAGERGFQLLTQVAGRAGRSPLGGRAIFQTFQPEHYAIQFASNYDYDGFYQQELAARRQIGYPPFNRLVRMVFQHEDGPTAKELAQKMGLQVHHWIEAGRYAMTEIMGPVPCPYARVNGKFRWQIILRGPKPEDIIRQQLPLPDGWRVEVDPEDLL